MAREKSKKVSQEDRIAFREDLARRSVGAYRRQCIGIGILVILFLFLLAGFQIADHLDGNDEIKHESISHYYHDLRLIEIPLIGLSGFQLGDVFVGFLTAVAIFLILFTGLSPKENLSLSAAGYLLLGVAFVPTDFEQRGEGINIHLICAVFFFLLIARVAIVLAPQRAKFAKWTANVDTFEKRFKRIGYAMVGLPAIAIILHLTDIRPFDDIIFVIEWLAIAAFAAYWLAKFHEFDKILTNEQRGQLKGKPNIIERFITKILERKSS